MRVKPVAQNHFRKLDARNFGPRQTVLGFRNHGDIVWSRGKQPLAEWVGIIALNAVISVHLQLTSNQLFVMHCRVASNLEKLKRLGNLTVVREIRENVTFNCYPGGIRGWVGLSNTSVNNLLKGRAFISRQHSGPGGTRGEPPQCAFVPLATMQLHFLLQY